jgi:ethanolamine utilization cobalamin adenosyltransferase
MSHTGTEALGWTATAVFIASYFFARPSLLRAVQMLGALLWVIYGLLINASPVIVANVLVFSAAAWTTFRRASTP